MGKTRNKITLLDKPGMRNSQTDSEPHAKKGLPRLTNKSTKPEKYVKDFLVRDLTNGIRETDHDFVIHDSVGITNYRIMNHKIIRH